MADINMTIENIAREHDSLKEMQVQLYENMKILIDNQKYKSENEQTVISNQNHIIKNQEVIVSNQVNIINNQKRIVENQISLGVILHLQKEILSRMDNTMDREAIDILVKSIETQVKQDLPLRELNDPTIL